MRARRRDVTFACPMVSLPLPLLIFDGSHDHSEAAPEEQSFPVAASAAATIDAVRALGDEFWRYMKAQ